MYVRFVCHRIIARFEISSSLNLKTTANGVLQTKNLGPAVTMAMTDDERDNQYRQWLIRERDWLLSSSSNMFNFLTKLMTAELLTADECENIEAKVTTSEKWGAIYDKVGRLGFSKINTVIGILNNTTNTDTANKFQNFQDNIANDLPKREGVTNQLTRIFHSTSFWFKVPEEASPFTGRVDEMELLHKSIVGQNCEGDGQIEITVITALSGLGGIGKTTLAVHYAWTYFQNKFYSNVIWINAETNNTIGKSLSTLAGEIDLNSKGNLSLIELASRIHRHFESTSTLFVFDNADELESVKPYLPTKSPKSKMQYVLITSRDRLWNDKTQIITLDVFPEQDSAAFLRSYLRLKTDAEEGLANEIARELQNLPLALRQAGAYIRKVSSEECLGLAQVMRVYLELLHTDSKQVLNFECDSFERTIYSVWKITLNKIKRQNYLAVRMIQIISYFHSDSIPVQLLENIPNKRFFKRVRDSMIYKNSYIIESNILNALKLLLQFCMITRDNQFNISVHRLVQKVIRDDVERVYRRTILDEAIRTVEIPLITMTGSDYEQNCLVHAMSVSMHIRMNHLTYYYEKFIDFVTAKQNRSTDVYIQRLILLAEESRYDEAEALFYKTRKEYLSGPKGEGNALAELCTVTFINFICKRIVNFIAIENREDEILRLSELCCKLLVGFRLSFGGLHLTHFEESSELLKSSRESTELAFSIQRSLVENAAQIYGILFEYSITRRHFPDVPEVFGLAIDCFHYLERWTDILGMIESLYELSTRWTKSGNGKIRFYAAKAVLEACDHICQIAVRIDNETNHDVQIELYEATLKIYNTLYNVFRKNKNYESTLQCGGGRIDCLIHLNRTNDVLEVIGDMRLVEVLLRGVGNIDGKYELLSVSKSIIIYAVSIITILVSLFAASTMSISDVVNFLTQFF